MDRRRVKIAGRCRMRATATAASVLIVSLSQLSAGEHDWTGLLGPNRDGVVQTGLKLGEGSFSTVWQRDVGEGYGCPLLVDDRVYQHARRGEEEVLMCLSFETGEVLWQVADTVPFRIGGGGDYHGKGPKSCPAYADGRIFTLAINGVLRARNADDGTLLWTHDASDRFQPNHPYWGASASPLVINEMVVVHVGNDDQGELLALSCSDGAVIWRQGTDGASYSSAIAAEFFGVSQVVEWNHRALAGLDALTGHLLWEVEFPHVGSDQNMPTPVSSGGKVFLGAENRGLHCYEPRLSDGKWTVEKIWSRDDLALDMSTAVLSDDRLAGLSHYQSGRYFCVNAGDGSTVWTGPARAGGHAGLLVLSDSIIGLNDKGVLTEFDRRSTDGSVRSSQRISDEDTWAPPTPTSDGLLIKSRTRIRRLRFTGP